MKRYLIATVGAAGLLGLAACGDGANDTDLGQTDPVNAVQDATSAVVGETSAETLGANTLEGYVDNAAIGDMYEIEAGRMAQARGVSAETKALGEMLVSDHTAAAERMAGLARAAGETIPTEMDERRQGLIDNLRAAQGAEFDRVFAEQQVAAHEEAISLHEGFADNADHPELAAFAGEMVPTLRAHLERARALEAATDQ